MIPSYSGCDTTLLMSEESMMIEKGGRHRLGQAYLLAGRP